MLSETYGMLHNLNLSYISGGISKENIKPITYKKKVLYKFLQRSCSIKYRINSLICKRTIGWNTPNDDVKSIDTIAAMREKNISGV